MSDYYHPVTVDARGADAQHNAQQSESIGHIQGHRLHKEKQKGLRKHEHRFPFV